MTSRATTARRNRERGATLVEFAIVLPILALFIFGIIDFGSSFNDWQSLRSAVRQDARLASVTGWGTTSSAEKTACNPQSGYLSSAGANDATLYLVCNAKRLADSMGDVRVAVLLPDNSGWAAGKTVRICAQAAVTSTTGITKPFLSGRAMTARVDLRIEQDLPTGATFTPASENPITSWPAKCT